MSVWFKDVSDYDGARGATKNGMIAALGFAAMLALGAFVLAMGALPGQEADPAARYAGVAVIGVEVVVALLAAWRFRSGKGAILGAILLLLFVGEIAFKLTQGFAGIVWYLVYLAVFLGLVNGIRGAWALKSMPDEPDDLAEIFA